MKEGWQARKLAELVVVQNGYAFSSSDYAQTGHFVMRIGNVQNGYISTADPKYIRLPVDGSLNKFVLSEGDVLVSLTGNVGRVGVIKDEHLPAALNQRVAKISIRNNSPATKEFLLLFLGSDWFREELAGAGHGAAQQNVSTKDLLEIEVAVPPLPEQQRIVALLDEAFAGLATVKANVDRNLLNARAVFESHLQSVFSEQVEGWVEMELADLCIVDWGNTDLTKRAYIPGGEFLAVSAAGCDGRIGHKEHSKHTPVLSAIGAQCGRMFLPEEDFTAIKNTITLTPKQELCTGKFLYRLLTHVDLPKRGAAQPFISKGDIQQFRVAVPESLAAQQAIEESLSSLEAETDRLIQIYERKIARLEELKKSLLQQAFNGEL